ncbi:MAG: O-antigen ligase family protein [Opitutaceae bacterium]|nr:O-antigen ligase family protein [Verrucomicrobiales bacterium]
MNSRPAAASDRSTDVFSLLAGAFIGLTFLKFGNPVIFDGRIVVPRTFQDAVETVWPVSWGYALLGMLMVFGLFVGRVKKATPRWALILPAAWLGWQLLSATQTVKSSLTAATLPHFVACVGCFYLGWFSLAEGKRPWLFWLGPLVGLILVFRIGIAQHFGGLDAARRQFEVYVLPTLVDPPVDLLKKMQTQRIFSTLFYPNTLAGVIILALPATLVALNRATHRLRLGSRVVILGMIGVAGLACLYWSGSKSGWLIAVGLSVIAFLRLPMERRLKLCLMAVILLGGIAAFFLKYQSFFEKGATSVGARLDYWRAAAEITVHHPVFGTGPGTFSVPYREIKSPNAEMARLCHNDYLEQASDSGIPGFFMYFAMIIGSMAVLYRNSESSGDSLLFAVWLGLLGAAAQGMSEFNLYIPAMAWPTFLLLGWLWGVTTRGNQIDNPPANL